MAFERQVVFPDRHPQLELVGSALVRLDDLGREIKGIGNAGARP
jgi:hypothetical protein